MAEFSDLKGNIIVGISRNYPEDGELDDIRDSEILIAEEESNSGKMIYARVIHGLSINYLQ